jgi:transcriptional regulator with XRE-family HTH domain
LLGLIAGRNMQRVPHPTFGDNVKRLRNSRKPIITQEDLARALDLKRNAQISTWETSGILPEPETIRNVAAAFTNLLGREVQPRELLMGVVTEYDALRGRDLPGHNSEAHFIDNAETQRQLHDAAAQLAALQREYIALLDLVNDFRITAFTELTHSRDRLRRSGVDLPAAHAAGGRRPKR